MRPASCPYLLPSNPKQGGAPPATRPGGRRGAPAAPPALPMLVCYSSSRPGIATPSVEKVRDVSAVLEPSAPAAARAGRAGEVLQSPGRRSRHGLQARWVAAALFQAGDLREKPPVPSSAAHVLSLQHALPACTCAVPRTPGLSSSHPGETRQKQAAVGTGWARNAELGAAVSVDKAETAPAQVGGTGEGG